MLRKHLKDAGLGLLITIVLVFLMEAGLFAIGVGRPDVETPLSRGFSSTDAYLVPDPEVAGAGPHDRWLLRVDTEPPQRAEPMASGWSTSMAIRMRPWRQFHQQLPKLGCRSITWRWKCGIWKRYSPR